MRIQLTILAIFMAILSFSNNQEKTILLDSSNYLNLDEYTYIFETTESSLEVKDVINKEFQYSKKGLNIGVSDKIYWVKYTIENPSNKVKEYYIYYPYNHINKIIAYTLFNGTTEHLKSAGTYHSYKNKEIDSRGYPILIKLKPGKTTIILRIEHLYLPLRGVAYLLTENTLRKSIKKSENAIWLWRGVFIFSLFITLVLFFAIRAKSFLYYFFLNFGVLMFFAAEIGGFFAFFDTDKLDHIIDIKHLGNVIILIFFPLFINEMTPIKRILPKLWKGMFIFIFIAPILWSICLIPEVKNTYFLFYTTHYFIALSGIVFILQLFFLFIAYRNKMKNALIMFLAYGFYVTAVFINVILPNLGVVENSLEVYNSFIYGSLFEIVMFMSILGRETLSIYKQRSLLLEKQKDHQAEIIRAIVESQEKERNRVGRDLHDMIGANISVIKQQVDKNNRSLINTIERTIESVRNLSHGLVTPNIKDDEFIDEIRELCFLSSSLDIKFQSHFHNWSTVEDTQKTTHLYRIVQELLQNAIKHSKAKNVLVQFIIGNDDSQKLTVMYEDDGIGFDYEEAYRNKGLGLINIQNRIKLIDGSIIYDTKQGRKGTTIIINLSLE